ncbi:MAG TPA: NAD-dependent epimerase/dehydratase family protein [Solirubrobacterales bacterium]
MSRAAVGGGRALVTGGHGFIGSHLAAALLAAGVDVRVLGRPGSSERRGQGRGSGLDRLGIDAEVEQREADLRDGDSVTEALSGCDSVFHLAAETFVGAGRVSAEEAIDVNVRGSWNVFAACREVEASKVVFASSLKAYGPAPNPPFREDLPMRATQPYDMSKAVGDAMARGFAQDWGVPIAVVRLANVYGEADVNFSRLVPETAVAVADHRPPRIRSDGAPRRDFLHIDDAVAGYLAVAEAVGDGRATGDAFNCGGDRPFSVREIIDAAFEVGGGEVAPEYGPGLPAGEVRDQYLDSTKLRELTGWEPAVDLRTGLGRTVDWYREHEEVRP